MLVWDSPNRSVLAWRISADWRYDPSVTTAVEVRFAVTGEESTLVELEHRGLDALGPAGEAMRAIFDSPGGWVGLLQRFVDAAGVTSAE